MQVGIVNWAQKVKKKKGLKAVMVGSGAGSGSGSGSTPGQPSSDTGSTSVGIQLEKLVHKASNPEQNDGSK